MNILYLHGLDSKLNAEKKGILENFGKVYAPDLDYYEDKNAVESILKLFPEVEMDVVIGSSMGGFAGYHVANSLNLPALLFNPALKYRSVPQAVPELTNTVASLKQIVIGQKDEVVNPADTLGYLAEEELDGRTDLYLHLRPELSHRIPPEVFEEETASFFGRIKE